MTKDGYISRLRRSDIRICTGRLYASRLLTAGVLSLLASGALVTVKAAERPATAKSAWAAKQAAAKAAAAKQAVSQTSSQTASPSQTASQAISQTTAGENAAPASAVGSDAGRVTSVRFWSLGDITRVAIEASSPFTFTSDHLSNPERIFFDVRGARPEVSHGARSIPVGDSLVNQIRIAETLPRVTRLVLDLARPVTVTTSQLANPYRLIVELHAKQLAPNRAPEPGKTPEAAAPVISKSTPPSPLEPAGGEAVPAPLPSMAALNAASNTPVPNVPSEAEMQAAEARREAAIRALSAPKPEKPGPKTKQSAKSKLAEKNSPPSAGKADVAATVAIPARPETAKAESVQPPVVESVAPELLASTKMTAAAKPSLPHMAVPDVPASSSNSTPSSPTVELGEPSAARNLSPGDPSLTRVLGLKLGRIVLDAGHGGQDVGTHGPSGYLEKDLVLDVAHRLGALIEQRMGSEVVFTRNDDTYVPLEERTHIANQRKADLFLSIHANSSPVRSVAGVETYVLNFTPTRGANELAARENASAASSMHDLKDLVEKIAAVDKANESREFAARLQTSLSSVSTHSVDAARNRGVKRAPFVVLIGASMPSVLAEIGFLTNGEEEALLRKPEHRQKIAEALYKGIASYAETLSRFDLARKAD